MELDRAIFGIVVMILRQTHRRLLVTFTLAMSLLVVAAIATVTGFYETKTKVSEQLQAYELSRDLDSALDHLQFVDTKLFRWREDPTDQKRAELEEVLEMSDGAVNQLHHYLRALSAEVKKDAEQFIALIEHQLVVIRSELSEMKSRPDLKQMAKFRQGRLREELGRDWSIITPEIRQRFAELSHSTESSFKGIQADVESSFNSATVLIQVALGLALLLFGYAATRVTQENRRRTALEVDLRNAQKAALSASTLKSQFLATVSHEIRTPLNGIIGMSELIRVGSKDSAIFRYADAIYSSGRTLLQVVNDLLDLSKIEAGKMSIEMESVHPATIVEAVCELFFSAVKDKGLQLIAVYSPEALDSYTGDSTRITQVLQNYVSNAIKFTQKGSIVVRMEVLPREGDQCHLKFAVTDEGPGIDAAGASILFQPFSRLSGSQSSEGTGLGLAICKRLAELMGGTLGVKSKVGEGAEFWCSVPVRKIVDPTVDREEVTRKFASFRLDSLTSMAEKAVGELRGIWCDASLGEHVLEMSVLGGLLTPRRARVAVLGKSGQLVAGSLNPKRAFSRQGPELILLVEDNVINQVLASTQLESLGYRVHVAENGIKALQAFRERKYDLILMDCRMPAMDGFDATRAIRDLEIAKALNRTPIVAMTANAMSGDREKCLGVGMDDYLTKPFEIQNLDAILNHWLSKNIAHVSLDLETIRGLEASMSAETLDRLISAFLVSLRSSGEEFSSLTAKKDWKSVGFLAHKVKSSAKALGAVHLANCLQELEHLAESQPERMQDFIPATVIEIDKVKRELGSLSRHL